MTYTKIVGNKPEILIGLLHFSSIESSTNLRKHVPDKHRIKTV